jgi:hypothetical protein
VQAVQVFAHFGAALEAPAAGHLHQLHAALGPVVLQVLQQRLDGVGAQLVVEQHAHLAHRQGLLRADQGGFEDALGIRRIHGQVPGQAPGRRNGQRTRGRAARARGQPAGCGAIPGLTRAWPPSHGSSL